MNSRAWAAFAAVSTLWGIPYLFIKVAVDGGVPPAFLAWVRVVLGAAVLLALAWRAGLLGTVRGRWRWLAVYAGLEIAIPFPLIAAGEQHVASSLADGRRPRAGGADAHTAAAIAPPASMPSGSAIASLVVLGLFCTAAAFVFFGILVTDVGPGRALVITYVSPVVAVSLGVTVLGERPGAGAVAGLLLILAGSWLSTDGRVPPGLAAAVSRLRPRRARPSEPTPAPPSVEPVRA
jgi:drug/metabolite transporter (DMT)-like permease